jgi:outer membrane protein
MLFLPILLGKRITAAGEPGMKQKKLTVMTVLATAWLGGSGMALAHEAGDWIVRFGASNIDPKSNNHPVVEVDSAAGFTINFAKMLTDRWSVELLAAYPYKHDIALKNGPKVGSTKHLPPTLSLQYHLNPTGVFQPYVGVGLNYTQFFSEKTENALEGVDLSLDESWGAAAEIGIDYTLSDQWLINFDVRYIDIEAGAWLDGVGIGEVEISPMVYGLHVGYKF